ncbi:MAG: STAS domain-containing protein [Leptospirales bacterium]|nr:STAS domain-containing protein [Leptospirales bacterium]
MGEPCQVHLVYEGGQPVMRLKGEITSEAEDLLFQRYSEIPEDKRIRVIIDFGDTGYINSSGIALLIQLITRAGDGRGKIEFAALRPQFRKVMDIVGLTEFVQVHATLQEALNS